MKFIKYTWYALIALLGACEATMGQTPKIYPDSTLATNTVSLPNGLQWRYKMVNGKLTYYVYNSANGRYSLLYTGQQINQLFPLGSPGQSIRVNSAGTAFEVYTPSSGGGGGGSGTVTQVTGANGVTVSNGTTTPLIGLGSITPVSVLASGTIFGSNLNGTNTGDETNGSIITKIGYTPENVANKVTTLNAPSNTTYPTTQAVATALSGLSTSPTGAAGGDLSGTYPNPTVARLNGQLPSYYLDYNNLSNKPTVGTGSVTSITPGTGFTSTTPITTTGTLNVDSTQFRTASNSFTKAQTNSQIATAIGAIPAYTASNGVNKTGNNFTSDTTYNRTVANSLSLSQLQTKLNTYTLQTRNIATGTGLTGGGDLTADRTIGADTTVLRTTANSPTLAQLQTKLNGKQNALPTYTQGYPLYGSNSSIPAANLNQYYDATNKRWGFGTIAPAARFDIRDSLASITNNSFLLYNSGVIRTQILGTGAQTWFLNSGTAEAGRIGYTTPGGLPGILFMDNAGNSRTDLRLMAGGGFAMGGNAAGTQPALQFYFSTSGFFGSGVASPSSFGDFNGNIGAANLRLRSTGGTPSGLVSGNMWNDGGVLKYYTTISRRIALTVDVAPANGQIPIGNGTDYGVANITAGSGVSITNGAGSITLATNSNYATSVKTTAYTLLLTDYTIRGNATGGAIVLTLPTAASAYDSATGTGHIYVIKKIDATANTVTVKGNTTELIDGSNTIVIGPQYNSITIQSNGTSWDIL